MGHLIRKQIYIEDSQNRRLKSRARARSVSETAIIRRGIDLALAGEMPLRPDVRAWEKEKAFIRERMKRTAKPASKRWSREELYEERLSR